MPKRKNNIRNLRYGSYLFVIVGLPQYTLKTIINQLQRDTSLKPARYVGVAAVANDERVLYNRRSIQEIVNLIERECRSSRPHRVIVPFVPSQRIDPLVAALSPTCFLTPLMPDERSQMVSGSPIGWRHKNSYVKEIVYNSLRFSLKATNRLKSEITDKRISVLTLPELNFYYPDRHTTIRDIYRKLTLHHINIRKLKDALSPSRFTREQLSGKAFKSRQNSGTFFQDSRGRVFPPDIYHGSVRYGGEDIRGEMLSTVVRQWYRFGVTVRDGNLHYDVQYELPRELEGEQMFCAEEGEVLITGTHANIGVNDFIWVPDGEKTPVK